MSHRHLIGDELQMSYQKMSCRSLVGGNVLKMLGNHNQVFHFNDTWIK